MVDSYELLRDALRDRYRVDRELGRGGMATVYLAEDLKHRRPVAIKVLRPELAAVVGPDRFLREIEIAARLQHPHVLPLLDSGVAQGFFYYVMPYVEGESLRAYLDRESQLAVEDAVRIAREAAEALEAAHRQGIVHRDVKPDNILLSGGQAMVADFGIARMLVSEGAGVTPSGIALGTSAYMSPEQLAEGHAVDARADVYSLGCVLYEMLAGQPPFTGPTAESVLYQHLNAPPPDLTLLRPSTPASVAGIVRRALAKLPVDRQASAAQFAAELAKASMSAPAAGALPGRPRPWWRSAVRIVGATGAAVLIVLLTAKSGRWGERLFGRAAPATGAVHSLAVLPLENLSKDAGQGYFVDGMTDELTSALAKISAIHVISRTSVMGFGPGHRTLSEIRGALQVDAVLEGAVLRVGDRVRINVRLVDTDTGTSLWGDSYDRELRDVLGLQSDVARTIAAQIRATLTPSERTRLASAARVNPEAHEFYLEGRYYWNRRTDRDLRKAIAYFRSAIGSDSAYALAYAGLAESYGLLPDYGPTPRDQVMPLARAAALRALQIDSTVAEAHAALGNVEKSWTRDWNSAERHYRRAIELDPNYATAHHWYAVLLVWRGRVSEAVPEMERARALDPLSPIIRLTLGRIYYLNRQYARAASEFSQAIELDPKRASAYAGLSSIDFHEGRYREAAVAWARYYGILDSVAGVEVARRAARVAGARDCLAERLTGTQALLGRKQASTAELAVVYSLLGDRERTFEWLARGYRDHSLTLGDLESLPEFDEVRGDERYADLIRKLKRDS